MKKVITFLVGILYSLTGSSQDAADSLVALRLPSRAVQTEVRVLSQKDSMIGVIYYNYQNSPTAIYLSDPLILQEQISKGETVYAYFYELIYLPPYDQDFVNFRDSVRLVKIKNINYKQKEDQYFYLKLRVRTNGIHYKKFLKKVNHTLFKVYNSENIPLPLFIKDTVWAFDSLKKVHNEITSDSDGNWDWEHIEEVDTLLMQENELQDMQEECMSYWATMFSVLEGTNDPINAEWAWHKCSDRLQKRVASPRSINQKKYNYYQSQAMEEIGNYMHLYQRMKLQY